MSASAQSAARTADLCFREGGSDKVYHVQIEPAGSGFIVNFQFGRRGSTLQTGTKTASPVPYDYALKIFNKIVQEKTSKGYSPGQDGTPYQSTSIENRTTDIRPQLLNPIEESEVDAFLDDPVYAMQEKYDGERRLINRDESGIIGINRKGLVIALPRPLTDAFSGSDKFLIDGEQIRDHFHAFDLLSYRGDSLNSRPYQDRYDALADLIRKHADRQHVSLAPIFRNTREKRTAFTRLTHDGAEGAVFKLLDAPYTPGRPASGGSQRKFKFTQTASVIVTNINAGKRSVSMAVIGGNGAKIRIPIGNVTIPANHNIPKPGVIAEVKYLYAYREGSLFQPVYLGERTDLDSIDCTYAQLKFKRAFTETDE